MYFGKTEWPRISPKQMIKLCIMKVHTLNFDFMLTSTHHRSPASLQSIKRCTFLCCPCRSGLAVHALELVEVRTDFDLVDDAFLQSREHHAPLRGDLHILTLPCSWGGQPWHLPVQNPVALDELRLPVNLRGKYGSNLKKCYRVRQVIEKGETLALGACDGWCLIRCLNYQTTSTEKPIDELL